MFNKDNEDDEDSECDNEDIEYIEEYKYKLLEQQNKDLLLIIENLQKKEMELSQKIQDIESKVSCTNEIITQKIDDIKEEKPVPIEKSTIKEMKKSIKTMKKNSKKVTKNFNKVVEKIESNSPTKTEEPPLITSINLFEMCNDEDDEIEEDKPVQKPVSKKPKTEKPKLTEEEVLSVLKQARRKPSKPESQMSLSIFTNKTPITKKSEAKTTYEFPENSKQTKTTAKTLLDF